MNKRKPRKRKPRTPYKLKPRTPRATLKTISKDLASLSRDLASLSNAVVSFRNERNLDEGKPRAVRADILIMGNIDSKPFVPERKEPDEPRQVRQFMHGETVVGFPGESRRIEVRPQLPIGPGTLIVVWGAHLGACFVGQEVQDALSPMMGRMVRTLRTCQVGELITLELVFPRVETGDAHP